MKCSLVWMCNFLIALPTYAWERWQFYRQMLPGLVFSAQLSPLSPPTQNGTRCLVSVPCRLCECQGARKTIDTIEEKSVYFAVFFRVCFASCDRPPSVANHENPFRKVHSPYSHRLHGPGFFSQRPQAGGADPVQSPTAGRLYQVCTLKMRGTVS